MARQLRIQYEGAIYHLMSRGDRREAIFQDDLDRKCFLQALGAVCEKTGLAGARLLFDEQSFSSGSGDAASQSGGGNEMAFGDVYNAL
jgi:hypothetical protein